ncbi:MAG: calcium-translocating P-type ATPase, PMCA-type [Clostridia bacterium]|nr:calcium-translocating P-type ATPase, PMCA-type [Clostridia bacterium]
MQNTIPVYHKEGLSDAEAEASRNTDGANLLTRKKRTSFFRKFLSGFDDPIIKVLLGALLINFVFLFKTFDILETGGILAAILIATLISALSERGGELAFDRLQAEAAKTSCLCLRNGKTVSLPVDDLVVGDIVLISAGERIPADGILLDGELRCSLAALNGEGKEVTRRAQKPFMPDTWQTDDDRLLLRGTVVTWGEGRMLILRVGGNTLYGRMTKELQTETRESPLRARLTTLAKQMSRVGYCAAGAVALSYLFNTFFLDAGCTWAGTRLLLADRQFVIGALIHALMLATTTIVVAVPEGLPMMISVVLSSNIRRMQRDHVLVRKPVGIETAGSLNLLFCDKTGTLTKGEPEVTGILVCDGDGVRSFPSYSALRSASKVLGDAYLISACRNTQSVRTVNGTSVCARGGNATDRAILDSVLRHGSGAVLPGSRVTDKVPFDSAKKYSSVTVDGVTYYKGAPEILLHGCTDALTPDGTRIPFDFAAVEAPWHKITEKAGRVLALCTEDSRGRRTFLCLISIRDDLRPGAGQAVKELQSAGIRVIMMTGDNPGTAAAIAKESGILRSPDALVLTSGELAEMSDEAVTRILPRLSVVARALPQDKTRLVKLAQAENLTVGMTGDGVNDAPALKIADVGFAMGSGTEVAQEAGDIVILDDNIVSITKAVLYGRTIFKSIRKFIMFQMTTNLSAVGISILCPLFGIDTPVTVLQMLWVNLIMDTLGSLAFAGEAPAPQFMKEPPKRRDAPIMNRYMVCRTAAMGVYLLGLCLSFIRSESMREHFDFYEFPVHFLGAFFALFIFADICNSVSARSVHPNPFHRLKYNKAFVVIFSFIIAVQLVMIYFGGAIFRTQPLSPHDLFMILGFAATVLLYSVIVKLILGRKFRGDTV